jgi:hypothetical protein
MKHLKYLTFIICLTGFILMISNELHSQSTDNIGNIAYKYEDGRLLISYDIAKSQAGVTYEIWLEVTTAAGEKIIPVSVYGDIKKGVIPGKKRTIIWDTNADDILLDDNFSVQIFGKAEHQLDVVPDSIVRKYDFPHYNDIGLGLGLDYGGILGVKYTYTPVEYFGVFGAAALQLGGFGWQVGIKGYIIPKTSKKGFRPNVKAMYGVNGAIYVVDFDYYNQLYLGPSVGPGMEIRFGRMKKKGLDIDINFPIRSQEFKDDYEAVKNDPRVEVTGDLPLFTISVGFHMEF